MEVSTALLIPACSSKECITVSIIEDDNMDEEDETFNLMLSLEPPLPNITTGDTADVTISAGGLTLNIV